MPCQYNSHEFHVASPNIFSCRRCQRKESTEKIVSAIQMRMKVYQPPGKVSSNRYTAKRNCRLGERYCKNPRVVNGKRRAAWPKHMSGTAETIPLSDSLNSRTLSSNSSCSMY